MNTKPSSKFKFNRVFANILSIFVILAMGESPRLRAVLQNQLTSVKEVTRSEAPGGYECVWITSSPSMYLRMNGLWTVVNANFVYNAREGIALLESYDGLIAQGRFFVAGPEALSSGKVRIQSVLYAKHFEEPPPNLRGWVAAAAAAGILIDFMPPLDSMSVTELTRVSPGLPDDYVEFIQQSDGCGIANVERAEIIGLHNAIDIGCENG